jgi:hypothetical protein
MCAWVRGVEDMHARGKDRNDRLIRLASGIPHHSQFAHHQNQ